MSMIRIRPAAILLAASLALGAHSAAQAHSHVIGQQPAANSVVTAAPAQVSLSFDGRVELPFSKITVTGPEGAAVQTGALAYGADDRKSVQASLPQNLAPGVYQVEWDITSADSHKVKGKYSFTIQP